MTATTKLLLAIAVVALSHKYTVDGFSNSLLSVRHERSPSKELDKQERNQQELHRRTSSTTCFAERQEKSGGGSARFTGLSGDSTSNGLDYVLSLIVSDVGSTVLGLFGLILCVAHRLVETDSLSADTMGQETRADLLAVFASGAVLLNGISKLDVTSALSESVVLDGETVLEPIFAEQLNRERDVSWALDSVLTATPANTAVLLTAKENDEWSILAMAGIIPRDPILRRSPAVDATPILDRYRSKDAASAKESYLPTLQALPGRVEFTYLPLNTQGALLLPVDDAAVLVLGTDTAKSFSPRNVAWCLSIATRIGTFIQTYR